MIRKTSSKDKSLNHETSPKHKSLDHEQKSWITESLPRTQHSQQQLHWSSQKQPIQCDEPGDQFYSTGQHGRLAGTVEFLAVYMRGYILTYPVST